MITTTAWEKASKEKVVSPEALEGQVALFREQNKTIATLNGSFDLMHAGHLQIIFEASTCADILIVALNSDSSIKQYKSSTRPIIPLEYRLEMMSALSFVDAVTWFDETEPSVFLRKVKPDVHVNGVEYGKECIEAELIKEWGGSLHLVSLVPGLSTSAIIDKIKASQ
jgi:rfaE bifunctional protein nucleotidyltransferase chain/domain